MSHELIQPLSFRGFKYECRIVPQPAPRLAPIVLIGGVFQDMYSWTRHEAGLAPQATVVTVDLPGYGAADQLPDQYGLEFLADALGHMTVELALPPVNMMGISYGSLIAYLLAQRHPAQVNRLLLCGVGARIPEPIRRHAQHTVELLLADQVHGFARSTVQLFMGEEPGRTVLKQRAVGRFLERRLQALTPDEISKYLQNARRLLDHPLPSLGTLPGVPTLVTTGEHDTCTTPSMCREVAEVCRDGMFTTIREADHLVHLERITEFVDLMVRFFGGEALDGLSYCSAVERTHRPQATQQTVVSEAPTTASMM